MSATSLNAQAATWRLAALTGTWQGRGDNDYFARCRHNYRPMLASVILTRDEGAHTGGWWKNPDYERCWHLSVSFADGYSRAKGRRLARAVFGHDTTLLWIEPPYSDHGKAVGVWHYRLFCDSGWDPVKPSGEVYSRRMPSGWKSFSEIHGESAVEALG